MDKSYLRIFGNSRQGFFKYVYRVIGIWKPAKVPPNAVNDLCPTWSFHWCFGELIHHFNQAKHFVKDNDMILQHDWPYILYWEGSCCFSIVNKNVIKCVGVSVYVLSVSECYDNQCFCSWIVYSNEKVLGLLEVFSFILINQIFPALPCPCLFH